MKTVKLILVIASLFFMSLHATVYNINESNASGVWGLMDYPTNGFPGGLLPGDTVLIAPGTYSIDNGTALRMHATVVNGTAENPIVIRAEEKGTVFIFPEGGNGEWWQVGHSNYIFENLNIDQTYCTHSFHATGNANFLIIRNCTFTGLKNAPLKANGDGFGDTSHVPDYIVYENNEASRTQGPWPNTSVLNGCNLDLGDYHVIRGNYFHDISLDDTQEFWNKNGTYGAFSKGGCRYVIIENNLSKNINGYGISLGGGGFNVWWMHADRRPVENAGCIVRNNVIVGPANRDGGNHAISVNYSNDNLIYNNTIINASPIVVFGNYKDSTATSSADNHPGGDVPQDDYVACGVGNVLMNNLSVNLFNMDSLWSEITGGAIPSNSPVLIEGIQFYKAYSALPMSYSRDIEWANLNTTVNNLRISNVNANDIFVDTAANDYRIKDGALDAYGRGRAVVSTNPDVQKIGNSLGVDYLSQMVADGSLENAKDRAGNLRDTVYPGFGAHEYTSTLAGLEDNSKLKKSISFVDASISPNPVGLVGTNIDFNIANNLNHLEITVWNSLGQMVYGVYHGKISKGNYNKHWNGFSNAGKRMAPGTYFVRFRSGIKHFTKKINLVK